MKKNRGKGKKKLSGATRKVVKPSRQFKMPWKLLLASFLFVAIGFVGYKVNFTQLSNKAMELVSRPVTSVHIEGLFVFVSKKQIEEAINEEMGENFVDVDIRKLKRRIEQNPWVESVSIRRVWPESLELVIYEQQPIARWGDRGIINKHGVLIDVDDNHTLSYLPEFFGKREDSNRIARWFLTSQSVFESMDLYIQGIAIDSKGEWTFLLNDNVELLLGRGEKKEKIERFLDVYSNHLASDFDNVKKIDLRYVRALAVSWKDKRNKELMTAYE